MGNEKNEVVESMQELIGLKEETSVDETVAPTEEIKEEETAPATKIQTTTVTTEQNSINKEIAKIDVKIESLQDSTVDISAFYDNLENELSIEEQNLEFSDKPAYMKLVNQKAREYETKNSKKAEIQVLTDEKKELEAIYERQDAIKEVSTKYPNYDHEKMLNFFSRDLSKTEQDKIYAASSSYADVYEGTFKKYLESNPQNINSQQAPNIPNVNSVRKQEASNTQTQSGFQSENDRLKEALGL